MGGVVGTRAVSEWLRGQLHVYVVTLARRPDRREWIEQQIPAEVRVTYASDAGLACDGALLADDDLAGMHVFPWAMESDFFWYSRPLTVGDIACAQSHLNCWRHARDADAPLALVIEDDAMLRKDFWADLEHALRDLAEEDWQLLYLFRDPHAAPDLGRINDRLVVPGYSYHTTAYVVRRDGLGLLCDAGLDEALVHIDEFLPAMYIDHPRDDMRARFPRRLRAVSIEPPIVLPLIRWFGSDTQKSRPIE